MGGSQGGHREGSQVTVAIIQVRDAGDGVVPAAVPRVRLSKVALIKFGSCHLTGEV